MTGTAEQICETYRRRWAIECLFKKIKQNFPLKYFLRGLLFEKVKRIACFQAFSNEY
jgi:IS4 transposase